MTRIASDPDTDRASASLLLPNAAVLAGGSGAIALCSLLLLPWPAAVASIILGTLMVAGADIDARTYLLPDTVTLGSAVCGVLAAMALDEAGGLEAGMESLARAAAAALALTLLRSAYAWLRGREGIGLGDVKLAAAVGAWLPLEMMPVCFGLAAGAGLTTVLLARLGGQPVDGRMRIPFGTFLCPALWLVFFASVLPG